MKTGDVLIIAVFFLLSAYVIGTSATCVNHKEYKSGTLCSSDEEDNGYVTDTSGNNRKESNSDVRENGELLSYLLGASSAKRNQHQFMRFGRDVSNGHKFMRFGRRSDTSDLLGHKFMRFGRRSDDADDVYDVDDDVSDEFAKRGGEIQHNFMRFGRRSDAADDEAAAAAQRTKDFVRFGRIPEHKFMRFGRK